MDVSIALPALILISQVSIQERIGNNFTIRASSRIRSSTNSLCSFSLKPLDLDLLVKLVLVLTKTPSCGDRCITDLPEA